MRWIVGLALGLAAAVVGLAIQSNHRNPTPARPLLAVPGPAPAPDEAALYGWLRGFDGTPEPHRAIHLLDLHGGRPRWAKTDAHGRYACALPYPGTWLVVPADSDMPGAREADRSARNARADEYPEEVVVLAPGEQRRLDVPLPRFVRPRIELIHGDAIVSARVRLLSHDGRARWLAGSAATDGSGASVFALMRAGTYSVFAHVAGWAISLGPVRIGAGTTRIALGLGAVRFDCAGTQGRAVPIRVRHSSGFVVEGRQRLPADVPYLPVGAGEVAVELPFQEVTAPIDVDESPTLVVLRPPPLATIEVRCPPKTTAAVRLSWPFLGGWSPERFAVPAPENGVCRIDVPAIMLDNGEPQRFGVQLRNHGAEGWNAIRPVAVHARRTTRIAVAGDDPVLRIAVQDGAGRPLVRRPITLRRSDHGRRHRLTTDAAGRVVARVAPARWSVTLDDQRGVSRNEWAAWRRERRRGVVELAEGETRDLSLRLIGIVQPRLRLRYRGQPVAGARVRIGDSPGSQTDAAGRALLAPMRCGARELRIGIDGWFIGVRREVGDDALEVELPDRLLFVNWPDGPGRSATVKILGETLRVEGRVCLPAKVAYLPAGSRFVQIRSNVLQWTRHFAVGTDGEAVYWTPEPYVPGALFVRPGSGADSSARLRHPSGFVEPLRMGSDYLLEAGSYLVVSHDKRGAFELKVNVHAGRRTDVVLARPQDAKEPE